MLTAGRSPTGNGFRRLSAGSFSRTAAGNRANAFRLFGESNCPQTDVRQVKKTAAMHRETTRAYVMWTNVASRTFV